MKGFGFSENATVTVGGEECKLVDASDTELKCRTPAVSVQTTVFIDVISTRYLTVKQLEIAMKSKSNAPQMTFNWL